MENKYLAAKVNTTQGDYRVIVGKSILSQLGKELNIANLNNKKCFLISDKSMFPKLTKTVHESLESEGFVTNSLSMEFSEELKTHKTVSNIYNWLADMKAERQDFIISMGGGVAGDIIGFAASTYLRGIPFVQIPTTLASMTDAAIGGKVAYNLPEGKNLVGSFYQPKLVFEDLDFLDTLPKREKTSGWAEAIKHSLIQDYELYKEFDENHETIFNLDNEYSAEILKRSVAIKAKIVSNDEFERGEERIKLNYGHTVGHAIEKISNFSQYLHGEAVSIGMMVAANISMRMGFITKNEVHNQENILKKYNLPVQLENIDVNSILEAIKMDKKNANGKVKWVLLESIGKAIISQDVKEKMVIESINDILN